MLDGIAIEIAGWIGRPLAGGLLSTPRGMTRAEPDAYGNWGAVRIVSYGSPSKDNDQVHRQVIVTCMVLRENGPGRHQLPYGGVQAGTIRPLVAGPGRTTPLRTANPA